MSIYIVMDLRGEKEITHSFYHLTDAEAIIAGIYKEGKITDKNECIRLFRGEEIDYSVTTITRITVQAER